MASPFAVFRRNQKILLAVVGIGAMVAFVFLPPLTQYMSGGAEPENPVVVETNYGDLTQRELENLKYSRGLVDRFLQSVTAQSVVKQAGQAALDPRWVQSLADRHHLMWRNRLMRGSRPDDEQAAIETLVLSKRAEEMGMVVSDQAINDLLKQLTADSITSAELEQIIRGLNPSQPVSVQRLFDALRTEMMASQYSQLFQQSLADVPPAQRFAYFARLNRRANAEVMPLAVADFVGQVADPSKQEVAAYYNRYKNDYPNPASPEPGFKQPPRASFQYFEADIDQLTEAIEPEVTDEEIAAYYDENKEQQFRALDFDDDAAAQQPPEGAEDETPPSDDADTSKPPASPGEQPQPDDAETPPADGDAPEKPAEQEKRDEPQPAKPEAEEDAADDPPDAESPQARRSPAASFHLASATLQDKDPPDAEQQPADGQPEGDDDPPAEAPPPDKPDPPPAKAESPDTDSSEKESSDEGSPNNEVPPAADPSEPSPAEAPQDAPAESSENEPAEKPPADQPAEKPQYEPLDKVADTIRTTLARQRAEQRVADQFEELSAEMRRYADELDIYAAQKAAAPKAKSPAPLNFAELAKGKDLEARQLDSVTAAQAAEANIGKAFRFVQTAGSAFPATVPFVNFAFSESFPTYKPEVIQNNDNDAFLFWKTDEEASHVPPLDQIRDQVVLAWKLEKARELARKRAEEYAVQARALKKPLADLFAKQTKLDITETGQFSWLTLGNVPQQPGAPPRLSEVEGVSQPGEEFMKAVFDQAQPGITVAMNEPQSIVYVIRVTGFEPPLEELRDDFARTDPSRYMTAALDDQRAIYQAWIAGLTEEAGVHWIRQADARSETEPDAAGF